VLLGSLVTLTDRSRVSDLDAAAPVEAWLVTDDGVRISAAHWSPLRPNGPDSDLATAFVLAHGFTGSWETAKLRRAAGWFREHGGVVALSFRGHGRSGGHSTLGDAEVLDLAAAVEWARVLGYAHVVTVGFSMGGAIVLRHAGLVGAIDAAVSVSAPSRWYYQGTPPMRLVQWVIGERAGRAAVRLTRGTRVSGAGWESAPMEPRAAAALGEVPLLIVHGDADTYFPLDHARQIVEGGGKRAELWVEPGFAHAESGLTEPLARRIALWGLAETNSG
jgi:pimeloyl-ACP methyl ester carboxylesterase